MTFDSLSRGEISEKRGDLSLSRGVISELRVPLSGQFLRSSSLKVKCSTSIGRSYRDEAVGVAALATPTLVLHHDSVPLTSASEGKIQNTLWWILRTFAVIVTVL